MKTIFSMGFPGQASVWMGQPSGTVTSQGIDYALDLYKKVQDWAAKTPNPSELLGFAYSTYVSAKAKAENLYPDVIDLAETLDTGGSLSTSENALANQFYDAATIAWGAIAQSPTTPYRPSIPSVPRPAGAPVAPSTKAAAAAAAAAKPSAGPSTNDLLLGGGLAVGVGVALYALTRG